MLGTYISIQSDEMTQPFTLCRHPIMHVRAAMQYSIHPSWAPTYCLEVPDNPAADPDGHLVQWEPWVKVRGGGRGEGDGL